MKIRKAKKQDLKIISEIFRTEYNKKPYNENWSKSLAQKRVNIYFNKNIIFVLEAEKNIAGFVIISTNQWHDGTHGLIDEIVVSNKHQGKGYGKQLLKHTENYLKKKEIKILNLFSVKKSKAFKFYQKQGFKEEKGFVSMVKKL